MCPQTSRILFPCNGHWSSTIRFSLLNCPDRAEGRSPGQSGKVKAGTILHDNLRLDPVGPIVTPVAFTGDHQIEIPTLELDLDCDQALRVAAFKNSTRVERIGTDGLRKCRLRQKDDNRKKEGWELHAGRELIHQDRSYPPERKADHMRS